MTIQTILTLILIQHVGTAIFPAQYFGGLAHQDYATRQICLEIIRFLKPTMLMSGTVFLVCPFCVILISVLDDGVNVNPSG